jgi:MFS family permease
MQIPTGILVDTWGAHRLLSLGAAIAGIGSLVFAVAPNALWAGLGRLLIGGSVAVAWVGMLKLANQWFAPRLYAFVTGVALFFGIIGAVAAGMPLRILIHEYGWRPVMFCSAVLAFAICAFIWWLVKNDPSERGYLSYAPGQTTRNKNSASDIFTGVIEVLHYPNTWLLIVIPGGLVGCVLAFSGLWGVPYLTTHHHMTDTQAAGVSSMLLVAWAIGGPVFGYLSDRIGFKPIFAATHLLMTPALLALLYAPGAWVYLGAALAGFFVLASLPIGVVLAQKLAPRGRSMVASLMMGFAYGLGGAFSPLVGKIADVTSIEAALFGLAFMPLVTVAVIWFFPRVRGLAATG